MEIHPLLKRNSESLKVTHGPLGMYLAKGAQMSQEAYATWQICIDIHRECIGSLSLYWAGPCANGDSRHPAGNPWNGSSFDPSSRKSGAGDARHSLSGLEHHLFCAGQGSDRRKT